MKNLFSIVRNLLPGKTSRRPSAPPPTRVVLPLASVSAPYPAEPGPEVGAVAAAVTIELPLASVAGLLPDHLRCRVTTEPLDSDTIGIPLQQVLPQLPHGDVRIPFGQLRQAAPHLFSPEADEDDTLVQLPYGELASRCDPALMTYAQQMEPSPTPEATPSRPERRPALAAPAPHARPNLVAASRMGAGKIVPKAPARPVGAGNGTKLAPAVSRSNVPAANGSAAPLVSTPTVPGLPAAPAEPTDPAEVLLVDLGSLAERWPEALRNELEQLIVQQVQVALPKALVSAGLKQGRVAFRWDALRSWLQPAAELPPSAHDETELELPLQVVAPLFLAAQREPEKPRRKLQIDDEIPDVFGMAQPVPAAAEADPEAGEPELACRREAQPEPAAVRRVEANRNATPEQLVSRAVQLAGVAGALVTLPDGLLVASRFPDNRDPDKVAAFLPQIFTRLGRYAEELDMGELATLEFLVGDVAWKAFRLKQVLFVVFGRRGKALPNVELGALAAELGKS